MRIKSPAKLTEKVRDLLLSGGGFIPLLGSGISVDSGIPVVARLEDYLANCIAHALGLRSGTTFSSGTVWNPDLPVWPRLNAPEMYQKSSKMISDDIWNAMKNHLEQNGEIAGVYQEGAGSLSEWRSMLFYLARLKRDSNNQFYLGPPDYSIIDSFFVHVTSDKIPNPTHHLVANLVDILRFPIILTTNFDDLIERAFEASGKLLNIYDLNTTSDLPAPHVAFNGLSILKLHGSRFGLRAGYSLDRPPSEEDARTFTNYFLDRAISYDQWRSAYENPISTKNHLFVCGIGGSDQRINRLVADAYKRTSDLEVVWFCHSEQTAERIEKSMKAILPELGSQASQRFHTYVTPHIRLTLTELYQQLALCLPPTKVVFPSVPSIPVPPKFANIQLTEEDKKIAEGLVERREPIVVVHDKPDSMGTVHLAKQLHDIETSSPHRREAIWVEMDDLTNVDDLFEVVRRAIALRSGNLDWLPVPFRGVGIPDDSQGELHNQKQKDANRIAELSHILRSTSNKWALFLYARDTPGANMKPCGVDRSDLSSYQLVIRTHSSKEEFKTTAETPKTVVVARVEDPKVNEFLSFRIIDARGRIIAEHDEFELSPYEAQLKSLRTELEPLFTSKLTLNKERDYAIAETVTSLIDRLHLHSRTNGWLNRDRDAFEKYLIDIVSMDADVKIYLFCYPETSKSHCCGLLNLLGTGDHTYQVNLETTEYSREPLDDHLSKIDELLGFENQVSRSNEKRIFAYYMSLFLCSRYPSSLWIWAAFPETFNSDDPSALSDLPSQYHSDRDVKRARRVSEFIREFENEGIVGVKPGGFLWMRRKVRNHIVQRCKTVLECTRRAADAHQCIADWYYKCYLASSSPSAVFESIYHRCYCAEATATSLLTDQDCNSSLLTSSLNEAISMLKFARDVILSRGYSTLHCSYLDFVKNELSSGLIELLRSIPSSEKHDSLVNDAKLLLKTLRVRCAMIQLDLAREAGEFRRSIERGNEFDLKAVTKADERVPTIFDRYHTHYNISRSSFDDSILLDLERQYEQAISFTVFRSYDKSIEVFGNLMRRLQLQFLENFGFATESPDRIANFDDTKNSLRLQVSEWAANHGGQAVIRLAAKLFRRMMHLHLMIAHTLSVHRRLCGTGEEVTDPRVHYIRCLLLYHGAIEILRFFQDKRDGFIQAENARLRCQYAVACSSLKGKFIESQRKIIEAQSFVASNPRKASSMDSAIVELHRSEVYLQQSVSNSLFRDLRRESLCNLSPPRVINRNELLIDERFFSMSQTVGYERRS